MDLSKIQIVPECLKTMTGWGDNTVYNVCNGKIQVVPWGTLDWTTYLFITLILAVMALGLIAAVTAAILNAFN